MWVTSSLTSKKQSSCSGLLVLAVSVGWYWNVCRWFPSWSTTRMLSHVPVEHGNNMLIYSQSDDNMMIYSQSDDNMVIYSQSDDNMVIYSQSDDNMVIYS